MKIAFQNENVTLWHGDCREVIPTLPPMPLVFTSPPYNMGATPWPALGHWRPGHKCSGGEGKWKRGGASSVRGVGYGTHADNMPWSDYVAWQRDVLGGLWDRLADDGAIFYNHKPRVVGDRLWLPLELVPDEVQLRQIVTWDRGGGINYTTTAFVPMTEWVLVLAKPDFRLKSTGVSGLGDVWRLAPERGNEHPAPFPKELPAKAIEATDAATVFDPFCGSGSTLIAALEAGKQAVGCEIDERWVEVARRRLERWHAQGRFDFGTEGQGGPR